MVQIHSTWQIYRSVILNSEHKQSPRIPFDLTSQSFLLVLVFPEKDIELNISNQLLSTTNFPFLMLYINEN